MGQPTDGEQKNVKPTASSLSERQKRERVDNDAEESEKPVTTFKAKRPRTIKAEAPHPHKGSTLSLGVKEEPLTTSKSEYSDRGVTRRPQNSRKLMTAPHSANKRGESLSFESSDASDESESTDLNDGKNASVENQRGRQGVKQKNVKSEPKRGETKRATKEAVKEENAEQEISTDGVKAKTAGKKKADINVKTAVKEEKKNGKNNAPKSKTDAGKLGESCHKAIALRCRKFVGAHVSAQGGVENALTNCAAVEGEALSFFLKNQRRWDSAEMSKQSIDLFAERASLTKVSPQHFMIPHGSYLVNLANPDKDKRDKSYDGFLDDIRRCHSLGIKLYNFHPGSSVGACTSAEAIGFIAEGINRIHKDVPDVVTVVENMSGQKNVIGSKFEDLRDITNLVEDKSRIGFCLDTCHLFAAGFDVRTHASFDLVMKDFDRIVGLQYLMAMHLNDSKSTLGSHLDRHEHIGKGHIGKECFNFIMNDSRFSDIPMVLETPEESQWKEEVSMLYAMVKEDVLKAEAPL